MNADPTELEQARTRFIEAWGRLGVDWGINRAMAQVHALLLVAPEPMDTEAVMARLALSRGSANTNLRALVDWGLVKKSHRPGVRREFFEAEKDMWEVARRIVQQRRKRELDPMLELVEALAEVAPDDEGPEAVAFRCSLGDIRDLGHRAGKLLDLVLAFERNRFFQRIVRLSP